MLLCNIMHGAEYVILLHTAWCGACYSVPRNITLIILITPPPMDSSSTARTITVMNRSASVTQKPANVNVSMSCQKCHTLILPHEARSDDRTLIYVFSLRRSGGSCNVGVLVTEAFDYCNPIDSWVSANVIVWARFFCVSGYRSLGSGRCKTSNNTFLRPSIVQSSSHT